MSLFELNRVSRYYLVDKVKKYVLKDISLSFPSCGFISILGKSGSGKSTLLNMIGKIDEPSEGTIFFNNKNLAKFKEKELSQYHSKSISFIFQHYYLLDNQTALYNIMLPALISGEKPKKAKDAALKLLNDFSINHEIINKKCCDLSGGERERIAILRSLINKPKVILADEPTGALDKNNAVLVMETLKQYSMHALVILVTHNQELAKLYSDRIIYMQDGKIIKDERINYSWKNIEKETINERNTDSNWLGKIISSNFFKRFKRNMFSILALSIGLISSLLIIGFTNGKDESIIKSMERQFDYGSAIINKEKRISDNDSPITLIQSIRPSEEDIYYLKDTCDDFHICYSYDALVTSIPEISINESVLDNVSYLPIYSFVDDSINHNLLQKGQMPRFDTLNKVVINKNCYELLNKKLKFDCLNSYLRIKDQHHYSYETGDSANPYIVDYFVYDHLVQISGVVDEVSFLNSPKIYYSYLAMDQYMNDTLLNNLSSYLGDISWKERVISSLDNEPISSYTCRLFLKDINDIPKIKTISKELDEFVINSNALTVEETLFTLLDAASIGMSIFLIIALVGVTMIIGIISFASYSEDIKSSAILLCLGAKRDEIALIYVIENLIVGLISVLLSFVLAFLLTNPLNILIEQFASLVSIIKIPFIKFHNRTFLLPITILIGTICVCFLATYIPILFSKKISLKEELKAND